MTDKEYIEQLENENAILKKQKEMLVSKIKDIMKNMSWTNFSLNLIQQLLF